MTLGMDDAVLDPVMAATGAKTMTLAIEHALRELIQGPCSPRLPARVWA